MSKLSIHLLTYNGLKYLPYCFKSLQEQTFQDFSFLIIDNDSADSTVNFIKQYLADPRNSCLTQKTKFAARSKNIGFAGGHNQALHWTKSEYVLLMNQDIIMAPGYLKFLVEFLDKNSNCAAVSGKLLRWDFQPEEYRREDYFKKLLAKKNKILDSCGLKIFKRHQVVEIRAGEIDNDIKSVETHYSVSLPLSISIFGISGALPMYRRSALETIKIEYRKNNKIYSEYFDNVFFNYKEDIDLAYRFCLGGYSAYFIPQAVAYHSRTLKVGQKIIQNRREKSQFFNYLSYRNHLYFLIKNVPNKIFFRHGFKILFYEISKLAYLILFEQKTLKAWLEVIKNFKLMLEKRKFIQNKWGKRGYQNIEKWLSD